MELTVKHFNELTARELYEIYKVRTAVFVVEQECPYQEVDEPDLHAYHVWLHDSGDIQAYLRVLPAGARLDEVSIGRVLTVKRGCGLGSILMREGIRVAREKFDPDVITLEAQLYARGFYEKSGFVQISDEFLEDDIPHVKMMFKF